MIAAAVVVAGCAAKPLVSAPATPAPAPAVPSLQQYLQDAARAGGEGNNKERARELYRTAARAYPASKEPWVKLSEDYFESANYGHAILAAQEVIQRDPQDNVAASVLAVSGLRVSAAAIASLRGQNSKLIGGPRTEAQDMARVLRDALGESDLVPRPSQGQDTAADAKGAPGKLRPPPPKATAAKPAGAAATTAPTAPPAPAVTAKPAPPPASADPFKILKK